MSDWVRDQDVVLRRETEINQTTVELELKEKHGEDNTPHDNNSNNTDTPSLRRTRKHDQLSIPEIQSCTDSSAWQEGTLRNRELFSAPAASWQFCFQPK